MLLSSTVNCSAFSWLYRLGDGTVETKMFKKIFQWTELNLMRIKNTTVFLKIFWDFYMHNLSDTYKWYTTDLDQQNIFPWFITEKYILQTKNNYVNNKYYLGFFSWGYSHEVIFIKK